jgi:predicted transcriptional regulator
MTIQKIKNELSRVEKEIKKSLKIRDKGLQINDETNQDYWSASNDMNFYLLEGYSDGLKRALQYLKEKD